MIAKWNIVQGTEEWHRERYGKIGGSTSKGLFVESDTLLDEILSERLEPFEIDEDAYIDNSMQRGIELEPMGRVEISDYSGIDFKECGWMQSSECDLIGISPDGLSEDETASCEIKCPSKKKHTSTIRKNEIPSDNIHQCLHYFTVNPKLQKHYFVSFRPESKYPLFVKLLTRDSLVDLGLTVKGKIKEDRGKGVKEYVTNDPDIKPISEWVKISLGNALKLESELAITLNNLEQI